MNGISRTNTSPEDDGLDPDLLRLFDANAAPGVDADDTAFVTATLIELEKARRARFFRKLVATAIIVVLAAVLAPYVARATLATIGWLLDSLPATASALASPIGCVCAALIAWRIARRRFS